MNSREGNKSSEHRSINGERISVQPYNLRERKLKASFHRMEVLAIFLCWDRNHEWEEEKQANQCIMTKEGVGIHGKENTVVPFSLGKERVHLF